MLRQAHRHCHRGVRFLHQDLRQLQLPHPVDLATANFDTLNHITGPGELDRVLSRVSVNLRRGGHFIFDFLTPCLGEAVRSACREVEGAGTMCQRIDWVSPGGLFRTRLVLRRRGGTQPLRISQLERAYPVAEVRAALDRAGMRILGAHEADTLRELRRCVPRVVIVARRTGCTAGDRRCSHP